MTTIQPPTDCVRRLALHLARVDGDLLVIGDRKGPAEYPLDGAQFFSLADQLTSPFRLARALPTGHYARKNIGYLVAISRGAPCIYETDDDNAPLENWQPRLQRTRARRAAPRQWANVYRMFTHRNIWPRGFPLDQIGDPGPYSTNGTAVEEVETPIQQGLANVSPDVDAIWRLVSNEDFHFDHHDSVWLPPGTWCPFNSQTTWWWPVVYPLLYLPSYCSFRMTDIWRSFVAQRCLWALGYGLVFHAPEVVQERNVHNAMTDFEDEIAGYLHNKRIAATLESVSLGSDPEDVRPNLRLCYQALVTTGILPEKELMLVEAWLEDIAAIQDGGVTTAISAP